MEIDVKLISSLFISKSSIKLCKLEKQNFRILQLNKLFVKYCRVLVKVFYGKLIDILF